MLINDKILLIILYLVLSIVIIFNVLARIKREKKISLYGFFELYFLIVYGLTPISTLLFNDDFTNSNYYFADSIKYYYYLVMATAIFYIIYAIFAHLLRENGSNKKNNSAFIIDKSSNRFFMATIIIAIIGWVALLLWTHAYGHPWDIIKYASAIRSGRSPIHNPFTFIKPLCSLTIIAFYCSVIIAKTTKHKIMNYICMATTFVSSIVFLLANDSRMFILVFFLGIILFYKNNNVILTVKTITLYTIIATLTLIVLAKLDGITYYIRNGKTKEENSNSIIVSATSEFSFTYRNGINVMYFYYNNELNKPHELKDLKNIILFWAPERLTPNKEDLIEYNTSYYPGTTGAIPADIITASVLKFSTLGIVIMPIIISVILKLLEKFFKRYESDYMKLIYNIIGCNTCLRLIAYYDLSNNIRSIMYIIVSTIIVIIVCRDKRLINDKTN